MNNSLMDPNKKSIESEAFTGVMIEDYHMVTGDQNSSATVIHELPHGAQPYYVSGPWGHRGQGSKMFRIILEGSIYVNIINRWYKLGVWKILLRSTWQGLRRDFSLKASLTHHLTKCCRNTDRKSALTTAWHESDQSAFSGSIFLPSQVSSGADGAKIFNAEEADDEAIIDTRASRAVIGSSRRERLARSFPPKIRRGVMKVPTDGVVFKFGKGGRLSSQFAVLLRRAQNDWFRGEVVPGHTPFLISNSVLGKLHGIVDVY